MLVPDDDYEQVTFADTEFGTPASGNGLFIDCTFSHCSLSDLKMRKWRFTSCELADCQLVAADLAETGWAGTSLSRCVLAGVQLYDAALRRVTFRGCKLDSVNFRSAQLTDVEFTDCVLRDVDFGSARLTRVGFAGSTVVAADLSKVTCKDVDLREARLGSADDDRPGIKAGYDSLRGTTIDGLQLVQLAPLLAAQLGIRVAVESG